MSPVRTDQQSRNKIAPKRGYLRAKDRILRRDGNNSEKSAANISYGFGAPTMPSYILSHNSSFKSAWTWFILCLTLYTAVMVPYSVAFQYKGSPQENAQQVLFWLIIDSFVDVVFIADIVVNFMTSLMSDSGEMIKDAKIIQMNYVSNWYTLDLLSCLPYDIIYFVLNNVKDTARNGIGSSDSNSSATSLFSALKVIRLLRVARVARKMDHFAEYSGVVLMILVGAFGLFGHWLACMWFAIGINTICTDEGKLMEHNWLVRFSNDISKEYKIQQGCNVTAGPEHLDAYLASLYFVMSSLTSVGFGNIAPYSPYEQSFSVVVLIFGALLYAMIFGNVTTIISQIYADMNRYHDSLNSVREFARFNSVPQNIEARIMDFMVTTWQQTKGIDTNAVINLCPKDLKADICVHLHRRVFNGHRCFLEASDACLRSLALEFQTIHVSAGDIVYHKGEYVDELSFVARGILEVLQDGEVIAVLSNGDAFGDNVWRRPLSHGPAKCVVYIRALSFTDIHVIKRASLKKVLGFYNDYAKSFDRELKLAVNVCESVHFRKIKRKKQKLVPGDSVKGGISSILAAAVNDGAMGLIPGASMEEVTDERKKELPMKSEVNIEKQKFSPAGSSKGLERTDAIETEPTSESSESENDEDEVSRKINPQVLSEISDLYSSVRDDSKRLNDQLERLEELLEGTLGVELGKKSRTESISLNSDEEVHSGGYTNTITSLIELPNKQSQTLKQMSQRKKTGQKHATKQSSLNRLAPIFQSRRLSKTEEPTNSDQESSY